jgi:hypothetical protein
MLMLPVAPAGAATAYLIAGGWATGSAADQGPTSLRHALCLRSSALWLRWWPLIPVYQGRSRYRPPRALSLSRPKHRQQ